MIKAIRWYHRLIPPWYRAIVARNAEAARKQRAFADRLAVAMGPITADKITADTIVVSIPLRSAYVASSNISTGADPTAATPLEK